MNRTKLVNLIWIIFIILITLFIISILGYGIYLIASRPNKGELERGSVRIDGISLGGSNLDNSRTVVDVQECEELFQENQDVAKAAVYEEATGLCNLKASLTGLRSVDEDDYTLITQKPSTKISAWPETLDKDIDASSNIFCSDHLSTPLKAATLCSLDPTCLAYTLTVNPTSQVTVGCTKNSTVLVTDTSNTKQVFTGSR